MAKDLIDIDYLVAALAQARNDEVFIRELVSIALDADSLEQFDAMVNLYSNFTRPPEPETQLPQWWLELCN
jgi:hypothetical protein